MRVLILRISAPSEVQLALQCSHARRTADPCREISRKAAIAIEPMPHEVASHMTIASLLALERIQVDVPASSKKRALEQLSVLLCNDDEELSSGKIFDALLARERLGSTSLGYGIAIPHARHSDAPAARAACMRLNTAVDFNAIDGELIDFVFGLLVPDAAHDEHVQTLAELAGLLSDEAIRDALRAAPDAAGIYAVVSGVPAVTG